MECLCTTTESKGISLNSHWSERPLPVVNSSILNQFVQNINSSPAAYSLSLTDRNAFISTVLNLLSVYGISLKKIPQVLDKSVDLFSFYAAVTNLGGYKQVTTERKWPQVAYITDM